MYPKENYPKDLIEKLIGEKWMAELLKPNTLQSIEEKAKVENTKEHILSVLKYRFKTVPKRIKDKLNLLESSKELEPLFENALKTYDLKEFEKQLEDTEKK